jgi:hypothetical protein
VQYPRSRKKPDVEGKNFEWFEKHKTTVLNTATEDKGLPRL